MSSLGLQATGDALAAIDRHVPALVGDRVASRLDGKDHTLWGPAAEEEASQRLGWMDLFEDSRDLVPQIEDLRDQLAAEGISRVVLAGMGGSSLAPEVIAATVGCPLTVLDSTDPEMVGNVLAAGVADTVLVVSSKSGSTVETDSQRRVFEQAFNDAGLDAASRIVVVTDPGSPLEQSAREAGYRHVFTADPTVGGRYSALTAFGLVPTGLAGVDIATLLDDAEETREVLATDDPGNPGLQLGAAMAGTDPLRNKLIFSDEDSGLIGFGGWAEQLIAESTGKDGTGVLPVVVDAGDPETLSSADDLLQIRLVADPDDREAPDASDAPGTVPPFRSEHAVEVFGSLGAQLLLWEFATAVAGRILGINPFDQPDVEAAKTAARGLLDATPAAERPDTVIGTVEVTGPADVVNGPAGSPDDLGQVLAAVAQLVPAHGYLAVQAYLDRVGYPELEVLRAALATLSGRPVTFGWGPRFLHSTGQYHKGGTPEGVFLQVTADSDLDLDIPGRPFTFGQLLAAQAAGDASVLREHGRPVVRLHLTERTDGIGQLLRAAHGTQGFDGA
ncbi:glucose-6-phosphate isomerase [Citricoccus zhacaiensis]|uniref:Glucose-6-phosphate isomerase n=1 Tax=Citricoccus zhacaiensis TaxID=489142 RepID=A0ABQ2M7X6_9MICC|nr:glucose-6-phosphate isomerase [Citricoccus zhacaiensis]GGO48001.1 glucose-6-phosphate isomerase [Citricoccus zhacaiensis]